MLFYNRNFHDFFIKKFTMFAGGYKHAVGLSNYVLYVFCSKIIIFSRYTSGTYFFFDFKKKVVFWNFSWNSAGFTTGYWSKNEIFLKSKIKRILHVSHVRKSILWLWKLYWVILSQKIQFWVDTHQAHQFFWILKKKKKIEIFLQILLDLQRDIDRKMKFF